MICRVTYYKVKFPQCSTLKYLTYKVSENCFTNAVMQILFMSLIKQAAINSINQVLFNKATSKELKKKTRKKSSSLFSLAKSI